MEIDPVGERERAQREKNVALITIGELSLRCHDLFRTGKNRAFETHFSQLSETEAVSLLPFVVKFYEK